MSVKSGVSKLIFLKSSRLDRSKISLFSLAHVRLLMRRIPVGQEQVYRWGIGAARQRCEHPALFMVQGEFPLIWRSGSNTFMSIGVSLPRNMTRSGV